MTIINGTSLFIILIAMFKGRNVLYDYNPADPRPLVFTSAKEHTPEKGDEWDHNVIYQSVSNFHASPYAISVTK
jgi:hypothetical protein